MKPLLILLIFSILVSGAIGIVAPLACIAACNLGAKACFLGFGYLIGTVTFGPATPATLAACSAAQSVCMKACWANAVSSAGMCSIL